VPAPYALVVSTPFPPGFFDRTDTAPDEQFYAQPRLVMHLDDRAVRAVGRCTTSCTSPGTCWT